MDCVFQSGGVSSGGSGVVLVEDSGIYGWDSGEPDNDGRVVEAVGGAT